MSLYSSYLLEKEGKHVIEEPGGFVAYYVDRDRLHICILFVDPSHRGGNLARSLVRQAIEKTEARQVTACVDTRQLQCSVGAALLLRIGFEIVGTNGSDILFWKSLG